MKTRVFVIIGIAVVLLIGCLLVFMKGNKAGVLSRRKSQKDSVVISDLLNQAMQSEAKNNFLQAKQLYAKLINDFSNSPNIGDWQKKIEDLNIRLLFSPIISEGSIAYRIKRGDSLAKIAKKFNTTVGLIKGSNNLSSNTIIAGRILKVWTKPFSIVVDKSQNILILKSNDEVFKTYTVATGINNSTPVGTFKIVEGQKLIDPPWHTKGTVIPPESPDNILGSRWMGLNVAGYGIHGTNQDQSLGQQITQGCIRMSNSDVEELFDIVPAGTEVIIVD